MYKKQRRTILKSPNPNEQKRIIVDDQFEMEADVLLNGNIFSYGYKHK
jgi:hypothetical protein